MKLQELAPKIVFVLALIAFIIGISAFSQKNNTDRYSFRKETDSANDGTATSRQRDRYLTDKDMDKLDAAMKRLDEQMSKLDVRMQKIDKMKIERHMTDAMKQVNSENINQKIEEAMKKVDIERMNSHLKEGMANIDRTKLKAELNKTRAGLEKERQHNNLYEGKIREGVEDAMKHARQSMLRAKEAITNMKDFTDELQKDGLIDKKKTYKIEVKSGELYIDDKKQSKEVSDKYRRFYKKENFSINMNEEEGVRV